uniref:RNase NYN domain-containing protein n=1 Tax=Parascaris equorum TaxID=6256 RepID=A0A914RQR7_PAREQ
LSSGEWITFESHDSCYSSCSEESHSSLSREPSDTLTNDSTQFAFSDDRLVEFATKLGYTEEQLQIVLEKLGPNAGQDEVLSELIKLGRKYSESSSKSNMAHTSAVTPALRSIVIDGSNIAMTHGRKEVFSCRGIRDCVQFFRDRGHTDILVFVPQFRREAARSDCPITDQHILLELEDENVLVWTPSRRIGGRRIVCHDDRYILKTAEEKDAVIVSNDEYRDLVKENPQYRKLVEQRLLMYSFVDGK